MEQRQQRGLAEIVQGTTRWSGSEAAGWRRWKAALNAFEITFDGRLSASKDK